MWARGFPGAMPWSCFGGTARVGIGQRILGTVSQDHLNGSAGAEDMTQGISKHASHFGVTLEKYLDREWVQARNFQGSSGCRLRVSRSVSCQGHPGGMAELE